MPHVKYEYTDNIAADADIAGLLKKTTEKLMSHGGVFPTGGLRVYATRLSEYNVADGKEDDAFVHVTFKYGKGREPEVLKKAFDGMFEMIKEHFAPLMAKRYLALSMEMFEFGTTTYKHNNIHTRLKKTG